MDKDIIKSVIKGGVIGTTIIKASPIVDKFIFTTCKNTDLVLINESLISSFEDNGWIKFAIAPILLTA